MLEQLDVDLPVPDQAEATPDERGMDRKSRPFCLEFRGARRRWGRPRAPSRSRIGIPRLFRAHWEHVSRQTGRPRRSSEAQRAEVLRRAAAGEANRKSAEAVCNQRYRGRVERIRRDPASRVDNDAPDPPHVELQLDRDAPPPQTPPTGSRSSRTLGALSSSGSSGARPSRRACSRASSSWSTKSRTWSSLRACATSRAAKWLTARSSLARGARGVAKATSPEKTTFVGSFGGKVRDDVLSVEACDSLLEAKIVIEDWRTIYNTVRPHSSLGWKPRRLRSRWKEHLDKTTLVARGPTKRGPVSAIRPH